MTDHRLSSLAGQRVLKRGGNAADAAVAAAAAYAVIDPYMAGLGGFGYALVYSAEEDRVFGIDYIGVAPKAARIDLYTREKPWEEYKATTEGMLAALVPGIVAGWLEILDRLGTMKLRDVLAPAIELARGYTVSERLHGFYQSIMGAAGSIPDNARTFYSRGHYPFPGETLPQPDLARTLETLARRGGRDYYEGSIAKKIIAFVRKHDGIMTEEDLASYGTRITKPVTGRFRDYKLYSHPPGSSGITVLQCLNILEGLDFEGRFDDEKNMHLFLEAAKLALRDDDRWNTGKDYVRVPVKRLTSKAYAAEQRSKIGERASFYELVSPPARYGRMTKHHCTCDERGNIVAATETQMFGFDKVGVLGDLGFNMNDGMCYFSLDPKHVERLEPGQRPRYVMSPTFAFRDDRVFTVGAAGGWTIPQTVAQVLFKIMQFGMEVQEAVSALRYLNRYRYNSIPYAPGTVVDIEPGIPPKEAKNLAKRGHTVFKPTGIRDNRVGFGYGWGAVNALMWSKEGMRGGAENRRDGYAAIA